MIPKGLRPYSSRHNSLPKQEIEASRSWQQSLKTNMNSSFAMVAFKSSHGIGCRPLVFKQRRARRAEASSVGGLSPKSEIKTAGLHQSVGQKRFGKISPDHCGYGFDFSKTFLLQHLDASPPFKFRISS
jgi:hypothetical protein